MSEDAKQTKPLSESVDPETDEVVEPENALPEARLQDLSESIRAAMKRAGWASLMPVQAKAMPYALAQRDLMVQSRTGSGKTGAFLLPMLESIDPEVADCQALVLVPTRELARQVSGEAELLTADSGINQVAVYGGVSYGPQIEAFGRGAHIVVGTPGRVLDHLLKRNLSLDHLKTLVFDEADRMLSMGFYPDMQRLRELLPRRPIRGYMFSATYPPVVMSLAGEFLEDPQFLSLSRDRVHVAETEHVFYEVPAMDKDRYLIRVIESEHPDSGIIFCNTKSDVQYVSVVLQRFGYDADALSSDLAQNAREKVLGRLRDRKLRFLVATDVAARGIDIVELSHVFNYGVPQDPEGYIHRVGRTSRADAAAGTAITLVSGMERMELKYISKRFGIDLIERAPPTDEDVQKIVGERVTALLEARLRDRPVLQRERMQRFVPLARKLGDDDDEIAVIAMLLDDYYQECLHAPLGGPPAAKEPKPAPSGERERRGDRPPPKRRRGRRRGGHSR